MKNIITALCFVAIVAFLTSLYLFASHNDAPIQARPTIALQDYKIRSLELASQPLDTTGFIGLAEIETADGTLHAEIMQVDGNLGLGAITLEHQGVFTSNFDIEPAMLSQIVADLEMRNDQ